MFGFKNEEQIRADERLRLFDELMKAWPKHYNLGRLADTPDEDRYHEMIGQNMGRGICRKVIEQVFGLKRKNWVENRDL